MLKLNNPHMMYQPVLLHGAGYNPHAYKSMSGDGIGSLFKAFSKGISRVFSKLVPAVSSSAKNLARSTGKSVADAGKKYIRDNKGDLLNLANQAKKAGINLATEAGANALSDIISGENVVEVAKKRSSQALRKAQQKASELSSGELAQQRRKIGDLLRQEKIRGIQKAQEELKNVESSVINTIVEEQNEIQNEVRESANDLLNRLGIRRGQGLTQIGVRRKGRGLKQLGTGKGKGLKQLGTGSNGKKKRCEKCNVSVRDMARHKRTKKHNRA